MKKNDDLRCKGSATTEDGKEEAGDARDTDTEREEGSTV